MAILFAVTLNRDAGPEAHPPAGRAGLKEGETVTPRPSHLPNHYERSALTKRAAGRELPFTKLFPAGRTTIAKLLEKGWIERAGSTQHYRITEGGKAALRAEMP
jgi:hypothetical protein